MWSTATDPLENQFRQSAAVKKTQQIFGRNFCLVFLVGGKPTPLKNIKVSWEYYSQDMEKYKIVQTTNQV